MHYILDNIIVFILNILRMLMVAWLWRIIHAEVLKVLWYLQVTFRVRICVCERERHGESTNVAKCWQLKNINEGYRAVLTIYWCISQKTKPQWPKKQKITVLLYFTILWIKNLGRAWMDDCSTLCGITWSPTVAFSHWIGCSRESRPCLVRWWGWMKGWI